MTDQTYIRSPAISTRYARVSGGEDGRSEAFAGMVDALLLDAGLHLPDPHPAAQDFRGRRLHDHARTCLKFAGHRSEGANPESAIRQALDHAMHRSGQQSSADFGSLLSNVANRAAAIGFKNAPVTWPKLVRVLNLQDFNATEVPAVSSALLEAMPQNGEFPTEKLTPSPLAAAEFVQPKTYGGEALVSRAAILNDDLGILVRTPENAGRVASQTIEKLVIDYLTQASGVGPTLRSDSKALFHADHGNYTASGGAAPSVTTLKVARTKLRRQTDPGSGVALNIPVRSLLVPAALETDARVLAASEAAPGNSDPLQVLVSGQLDSVSATAWYAVADPKVFDTLVLGSIGLDADGMPEVTLESRRGWTVDGIWWRTRIYVGVAAIDYRGVYRNVGA